MTNYINDILELLEGDTPRQKYEYLKSMKQNSIESEKDLLAKFALHLDSDGFLGTEYIKFKIKEFYEIPRK